MSLQPWEPNNPNSFPPIQLLVRIAASTHYTYRRFRNVEVLHTHTHILTQAHGGYTQTHTQAFTHHMTAYTQIHSNMYGPMHMQSHVCVMHVNGTTIQVQHSFKRAYKHTHTYTHTQTHTDTHTHTHTHTQTLHEHEGVS